MKYTVLVQRRLPPEVRRRIDQQLLALENSPRPSGISKLAGRRDSWRLRTGHYRILLEIDDPSRRVTILRIAHRREVYRP